MTDNRNGKKNAKGSATVRGIKKLYLWLQRKLRSGLVGKILCGYTKENEALSNSFMNSAVGSRSRFGSLVRKIRFSIAEQFEGSRILMIWRKFINFLAGCQLRFYGSYFMTFGVYVGVVYFFKRFFFTSDGIPSISYLIIAAIVIICSVPLLFSRKTLASAVKWSKTGNYVFVNVLGIPDEKMDVPQSRFGDVYNLAIFAGVVTGTLSFFVNPLYMIGTIIIFGAFALVITYPEMGVLAALGLLPFLSANPIGQFALLFIVCIYSFGYFIKLLRGKRVLNFEITDLMIVFFGICLASFGISSNVENSVIVTVELLIYLVGALVAGNLMRTKTWQKRCAYITLAASTLASMTVILRKVCAMSELDLPFLSGELALFDGGEVLVGYLIIALTFAYAGVFMGKNRKAKTVFLFAAILIIAAIVLLRPVFGMIGAFVASWMFFFIITDKSLTAAIFTGAVASGTALIYPKLLISAFGPLWSVVSNSFSYAVNVWHGTVQLIMASFFEGIGVGGFSEFYPMFAVTGFERIAVSSSLWLRMISEIGILGFIALAAIGFVFIQNCFEYLTVTGGRSSRGLVSAGYAAIAGIFVQSLFIDLFSSGAFFYAFFSIITVLSAVIRTGRRDLIKKSEYGANTETAASVDL